MRKIGWSFPIFDPRSLGTSRRQLRRTAQIFWHVSKRHAITAAETIMQRLPPLSSMEAFLEVA
nr:hypothetical protein [Sphingopyxis sp.]